MLLTDITQGKVKISPTSILLYINLISDNSEIILKIGFYSFESIKIVLLFSFAFLVNTKIHTVCTLIMFIFSFFVLLNFYTHFNSGMSNICIKGTECTRHSKIWRVWEALMYPRYSSVNGKRSTRVKKSYQKIWLCLRLSDNSRRIDVVRICVYQAENAL